MQRQTDWNYFGGIERANYCHQTLGSVFDGNGDSEGILIYCRILFGLTSDRLQSSGKITFVGHLELNDVSTEPRLKLITGAFGNHFPAINHCNVIGQFIGFFEILRCQ